MDERTKRLRKAVEDSGYSQTQLCEITGINKGALSSYLSGRYYPKQQALEKLSEALNVPIFWLMGYDDDNLSPSDRKDIAKSLDEMMEQLESGTDSPLMYNGQELSETSKALLKNALEYALTETKKENKVKYNPNKNKG